MIEQVKFIYSTLEKEFEKQAKTFKIKQLFEKTNLLNKNTS